MNAKTCQSCNINEEVINRLKSEIKQKQYELDITLEKMCEARDACVARYEDAEKEIKRLNLLLEGEIRESLKLMSAGPGRKGFEINLSSKFMPMISEMLACWFEEQGGINYVECSVSHEKLGPLVLTLQRVEGKTAHELRKEVEVENTKLKEENTYLKRQLEECCN